MNKVLDLAKKILKDTEVMMSPNEIYDYALKNYSNDLKDIFSGSTPEKTIGATKDKTKNTKKNKHTWLHADIFGVTFFQRNIQSSCYEFA